MCEAEYGGTCDCKCMKFYSKDWCLRNAKTIFDFKSRSFFMESMKNLKQLRIFFHSLKKHKYIDAWTHIQASKAENMRTTTWDNDVVWHVWQANESVSSGGLLWYDWYAAYALFETSRGIFDSERFRQLCVGASFHLCQRTGSGVFGVFITVITVITKRMIH